MLKYGFTLFKSQKMKFKNINSVLFLAASLAAGHVAAQSTHFSGWSAALGGSVVDGNLKINELNQGQAGNLGRTKIVATFDAGYSMPLNDKWALGMGASYDLSESRILDVVLLNGKVKNHSALYLQPTLLLTPNTAAFAKVGYHSAVLVGEGGLFSQAGGFSESIHGTGLGLGLKSYINNDVFVQFEVLSTKFKSKSVSLGDALTPAKASLTSMNVSLGYQFN